MDTISILSNSIGVNCAVLVVGLLLFQLLWSTQRFAGLLRPRLALGGRDGNGCDARRAPPIPRRRWLTTILWMRGDDLIQTIGLDAYFYLRYQTLAIVYFGLMAAVCCSILIPYHMSADPNRNLTDFHFSDVTLGHVPNGDRGLWLHVALAYVQAVVLVGLLVREAGLFAATSARYHLDATRTIQVNALPADLHNDEAWWRFAQHRAGTDLVIGAHVLRQRNGDPTPVAFTTMASAEGSVRLLATLNGRCPELRAIRAPLPDEIAWDNLAEAPNTVLVRRLATSAVVVILIAFWTVPLTGIASMSVWLPSGFAWAAVLPAWAFLLLLTVTPRLLDRLSLYERHATHAARHRSVFGKFVWVLLLDFFLFGTVSRGLLQTLWKTAAEPFYFSELLATTVPEQSTIIIIYMLSFTCLTLPFVDLNRIVAALVFLLKRGVTPSALPLFPYGEYYSYQVLHVLIGYTYATLAPLMLPFVLLYFVVATVVAKVQFCYVYGRREGCGSLFPAVLTRTLRSALIGCAILISVLLSKQGTYPALALIPILGVLVVADVHVRRRCRSARGPDLEDGAATGDPVDPRAYRPPWMKASGDGAVVDLEA